MKICVAQTQPLKGDIKSNIENHKRLIDLALSNGANFIVFPELSLTGYEPTLAKELAINENDSRLDDFQKISDSNQVTIGVGAPIQNTSGISISMVVFQPGKARQLYSKKYLHSDEEAFFVSRESTVELTEKNSNIALAICYELSVPAHSENAYKCGAEIYIASVAKTDSGVEKAASTLSALAKKYSMTVLMSNCIGLCDDFISAGKTSIWYKTGTLAAQLNDVVEGLLIIDTDSGEILKQTMSQQVALKDAVN